MVAAEWTWGHGKKYRVSKLRHGGRPKAAEFLSKVSEQGLSPEQAESVHSSTLRAWVKDQTEKGEPFPMELFGAHIGQRALIKEAKK